jgi:hypothetical protein
MPPVSDRPKQGTIDLIARRPGTGDLVLVLVETRSWGEKGELLLELQEKLHTYLDIIESGALARKFPESAGKRVIIRLDHAHPPGPLELKFLAAAREQWMDPLGIGFESGSLTSGQKA